jgi:hypothetical protein
MTRVLQFAESRAAIARRIERARIRLRGRGPAVEAQRDLEKLLAAAQVEQAVFFHALAAALLEEARSSFRQGTPFLPTITVGMSALADRIAALLAAAGILGRIQVRRDADLPLRASAWRGPHPAGTDLRFGQLDDVGPARAIEYLRKLTPLTRAQWDAAVAAQRARAFTIAGVNQQAALEKMRDLIAESLEAGLSPRQFELRARELLRNFETTAGKLRTVWNTNVGQALAEGRREELNDPEVRAVVSWRLFDAMLDQFVRPNHALLEGALAPADWWDGPGAELQPLLGFNCRCVLLGVTAARARRLLESGSPYFNITERGIPLGAGPDANFRRAA